MTHKCPGPGCAEEVDPSQLLCPRCWYQVPKPIRRAVHIAWNRGAGAGAPAHRAAVRLAVAAIRREVIPHHPSSTRTVALPRYEKCTKPRGT